MRLRVLRNLGAGWPPYKEGEEVEIDSKAGKSLVSQGLAEPLPIQAIPATPIIPVAIPQAEPEPAQETKGAARKNKDK